MADVSGIKIGSGVNVTVPNFNKSNNTNTNLSGIGNSNAQVEDFDLDGFITKFNDDVNNRYEGNSPIVKNLSSSYLNDSYQELFKTFTEDMKKDATKIDSSINMLETSKSQLSLQLNDKQKELTIVNGDINLIIKELKDKGFGINSRSLPEDFNSPVPIWMYSYDNELIKKYVDLKRQQDSLNEEILSIHSNIDSIDAAQSELFYSKFKLDPRYKEFGLLQGYSSFSAAIDELKDATAALNKIGATKSGFTPLDGSTTYDVTAMEDPAFNVAIMKYNAAVNNVNSLQFQIQTKELFLHSIGIPFPKSEDPSDLIELKYLNDDQIMFLAYLKKYYGQEKALEYYNTLVGDVNRLKGQEEAMKLINSLDLTDEGKVKECLSNLGIVVENGFADGINSFFEGIRNTIMADGEISVDEYKTLYFLQYLDEKSPKYYSAAYQTSSSIGNMTPSITASVLVTALGAPTLAPTVASILMGASAGGNAREKALQGGSDQLSSILYGCLIGCSETMLGEFLGNIPGISASSAFSLSGFLKEGGEEFLQEYVDAFLQAGLLKQEINLDEVNENARSAFIMGMFTSFLLNGAQGTLSFTLNGIDYALNADQVSQYLEQANGHISNGEVDVKTITDALLGNSDYMYTNSKGEVGVISSGELSSFLSNPSKLIDGINNGTYDLDMISALQKYYIENSNSMSSLAKANYNSIISKSGVECTDVSSVSSDYSVGMLNQNSNAFSEYCKYLNGLDSENITYELSSVHQLYCEIQDGKYIVDTETLGRIKTLENIFMSTSEFSFSTSFDNPLKSPSRNTQIISNFNMYGINMDLIPSDFQFGSDVDSIKQQIITLTNGDMSYNNVVNVIKTLLAQSFVDDSLIRKNGYYTRINLMQACVSVLAENGLTSDINSSFNLVVNSYYDLLSVLGTKEVSKFNSEYGFHLYYYDCPALDYNFDKYISFVEDVFNKLPESMRGCLDNLYLDPTFAIGSYSPVSNEYQSSHGVFGQADCKGDVILYTVAKPKFQVLAHEIAHNYDTRMAYTWGISGKISESSIWLDAMNADEQINGLKGCTDYAARTNSTEDFAEAVSLYLEDPSSMDAFPNRKKILDAYLN